MSKTKMLSLLALVGLINPVFATDARVAALGNNTHFIMDDISIFDNPADIGLYPNVLIGELGAYNADTVKPGTNRDPQHPWFGGSFALGLGEDIKQNPKIMIAGAFNRVDQSLQELVPQKIHVSQGILDSVYTLPQTSVNFDGFLGFSTPGGQLYASHIYVALQNGGDGQGAVSPNLYNAAMRFDLGTNFKLNEDASWEISAGLSRVQFGADTTSFWDPSQWGFRVSTRLVNTLDFLHGELVPMGLWEVRKTQDRSIDDLNMGLGVQVNMDRNLFFWLGAEYVYQAQQASGYSTDSTGVVTKDQRDPSLWTIPGESNYKEYGGRVSFGVERNIWTDWLLIRVGGSKRLVWRSVTPPDGQTTGFFGEAGNYYTSNPTADGTPDDNVGVGLGINIEEKLKIDAVVAEDVFYRNPFEGEGRIFSRISAIYQF